MNPLFRGDEAESGDVVPIPIQDEKPVSSGGVVLIEVFALELHNVPDQQFSILIGHPDESAMEAIRVGWVDNRGNTQHFEVGLKEYFIRKEQDTRENLVDRENLIECDTDATAADVDRPLDKRSFRRVAFRLKTDRQGDGDAIKLTAIFRRRL